MRIGVLSASIYMYQKKYPQRIFAPRDLAINLVDGLVDKGHEVFFFTTPDVSTKATVISNDPDLLEKSYNLDYQQDLSPEMIKIVSLYETKKYYELGLTQKAFSFAIENNLDIVHIYHSFSNLAHYFDIPSKIKTLFTIHNPPPPKDTFEYLRYNKFAHQNFVAISKNHKNNFQNHISNINILDVVYHGLKLEKFLFEEKKGSYFSFIGRLVPEKGLHDAISVILTVGDYLKIATHPNPIIEKSNYYQREVLPSLSNSNIHMVGFVKGKERIDFFSHSKGLISPLHWEEPFGLVMIESMACGTPIIAYNRGSVPEIVRDGITGFIIDPDDENRPGKGNWIIKKQGIEGLVEAVKRIGEIDRRACREHIEKNFTADKMADNYEEVYRKVLNS